MRTRIMSFLTSSEWLGDGPDSPMEAFCFLGGVPRRALMRTICGRSLSGVCSGLTYVLPAPDGFSLIQ